MFEQLVGPGSPALALFSVLAVLIVGCGDTASTASAAASNPVQTALPTPTATPVMSPSASPTPSPSPKIVAGWPKVRQGGVTMTGRDIEEEMITYNAPVIRVTVTGLTPGEMVSLSGTGRYDQALFCGPLPKACAGEIYTGVEVGRPYCMPEYSKMVKGRVTIAKQVTADDTGTARATMRFVIPETKDACPVGGGDPGWFPSSGEWKVRVTDKVHGLRLAPETYTWGP